MISILLDERNDCWNDFSRSSDAQRVESTHSGHDLYPCLVFVDGYASENWHKTYLQIVSNDNVANVGNQANSREIARQFTAQTCTYIHI